MRAIFHIHTHYSNDASLSLERLFSFCLKNRVDVAAITDHNTLAGALEAQKQVKKQNLNLQIIAGEEIATAKGEIIGLFLTEEIPKGLSLEETLTRIKKQGGLVYLPHPFDSCRRERIKDKSVIEKIMDRVDIVEGFNSRNLKQKDNAAAFKLAETYQKPVLWGCDAHFAYELKNAIVEIPELSCLPKNFCHEILKARPVREKASFRGFLHSMAKKYLFFFRFRLIF